MTPKSEQTEEQPGADRFWGQFSQSRAGRTPGGSDGRGDRDRGGDQGGSGSDQCLEWCPICRSAELFRSTVSPELRQQAESIQHEAIGVLKAFLDAYSEKSAEGPDGHAPTGAEEPPAPEEPQAPRVTDIPLD